MARRAADEPPVRIDPRPRRGLRRDDAALYVGVSASKFDQWVNDGRMPLPKRVDGCVIWDIKKLDLAFDVLGEDDIADESARIKERLEAWSRSRRNQSSTTSTDEAGSPEPSRPGRKRRQS